MKVKEIMWTVGKGIFLFNKLSQISEWKKDHKWKPDAPQAESYVAQVRYISVRLDVEWIDVDGGR